MTVSTVYANTDDFRNETNIGTDEWTDPKLDDFLKSATARIDRLTGRTWQGTQTVTNEYYDGNGETYLELDQVDVSEVTALAVDDDSNGTYTDITIAYTRLYGDIGRVELDVETEGSTIEVSAFPEGPKTVKISYTYGNTTVPEDIRELCIMLVVQRLNPTPERRTEIKERIAELQVGDFKVID